MWTANFASHPPRMSWPFRQAIIPCALGRIKPGGYGPSRPSSTRFACRAWRGTRRTSRLIDCFLPARTPAPRWMPSGFRPTGSTWFLAKWPPRDAKSHGTCERRMRLMRSAGRRQSGSRTGATRPRFPTGGISSGERHSLPRPIDSHRLRSQVSKRAPPKQATTCIGGADPGRNPSTTPKPSRAWAPLSARTRRNHWRRGPCTGSASGRWTRESPNRPSRSRKRGSNWTHPACRCRIGRPARWRSRRRRCPWAQSG